MREGRPLPYDVGCLDMRDVEGAVPYERKEKIWEIQRLHFGVS